MHIEGHNNMKPFKLSLTRALVFDDYNNIIAAIVKYGNGAVWIGKIGDSDFDTYIEALGLKLADIDIIEA